MATGNEHRSRDPGEAAQHAKERATAGIEELGQTAEAEAKRLGAEAGTRTEHLAEAMHSAGESLRGKEDWLADMAEGLSRNLQSLSQAAREKSLVDIKHDAERLARQRPVVFMGAAVAVGVALGRLLRSAGDHSATSHASPHDGGATGGATTGGYGSGTQPGGGAAAVHSAGQGAAGVRPGPYRAPASEGG